MTLRAVHQLLMYTHLSLPSFLKKIAMSTRAATSVALVASLCALAIATNPKESSFREHIEHEMEAEGAGWLERKVVSHMSTAVACRSVDCKLFTVVIVDEYRDLRCAPYYLGMFGLWMPVPSVGMFKVWWQQEH